MSDSILCAIDFTETSGDTLRWSVKFCLKLKSQLTVLYTYRLFKQNEDVIPLKKQMEQEAMKNFASLEREILADKGIVYEFKMEVGFIDDRIKKHAKENKLSFLVMDKGIAFRDKEAFEVLIRQLPIPVVIVP